MAHIHTSGQMQHRHSCAWLALWHAFDERGSVFTSSLPTPGLFIRVPLLTDTHTYPLAFRPLVWFHGGGFVPPLRRHFSPHRVVQWWVPPQLSARHGADQVPPAGEALAVSSPGGGGRGCGTRRRWRRGKRPGATAAGTCASDHICVTLGRYQR